MLLIDTSHVGATFGCDSSPYYHSDLLDRGWKAAPTGKNLCILFFQIRNPKSEIRNGHCLLLSLGYIEGSPYHPLRSLHLIVWNNKH